MADQAGDGGHVLATDIDTTHLEPLADGTLHFGRTLLRRLEDAGLQETGSEGRVRTALLYAPWGRRPG
jgi:hypothetical protein